MSDYPWYTFISGAKSLQQGDIVLGCPIVVPPESLARGKQVEIKVDTYNVIIMSQSCDIDQDKVGIVVVCPVWAYAEFAKQDTGGFFRSKDGKKALREGTAVGYHLLNRSPVDEFNGELLVVDFRNIYGVDLPFLRSFVARQGQRCRLLPPYREHLSQAFARFFMRVGLPVEIAGF